MLLVILVFLGGVLTILSPCILPVLPFVFARSEQRFLTSGFPLLVGMSGTFAAIASLAAVGGAWAVRVNQYGRVLALLLLTAFAATLLSRHLADALAKPFVALGNRLVPRGSADAANTSLLSSLLLGVATGLLWAPCAGPILGLVLTGAAISGPTAHTTLLLFAYAAGAATSLGIALLAGGRVFAALKRSLGAGEWIRRGLGIAVLIGVVCIAFGWDTSLLARLSLTRTSQIEQSLLDRAHPRKTAPPALGQSDSASSAADGTLPVEGQIPSLAGATGWLNSPPLTSDSLRGKVVLIDFWTYSCINCLRTLPYVKAWWDKYKDHGLVIVGVHTPEFAFEKDPANVRRAVQELGVGYPVALDADYRIWRAFNNQYWPADYFIDGDGRIRYHYFSEGDYEHSEAVIRELLTSAGYRDLPPAGTQPIGAQGALAAADVAQDQSPETYVGYRRAENFASRGGFDRDTAHAYALPSWLDLNHWGLQGVWTVGPQSAVLNEVGGQIAYRFAARDLHLVLGPGENAKPVRFRVQLDGGDPGQNHGADTDARGYGVITEQRLYQLIRQSGAVGEHVFSIQFLDDGVQAYAFTFG
jgi:cytochrome c biogenesis protein CcdA/thiol-disulfide isomerase/thioredoxin